MMNSKFAFFEPTKYQYLAVNKEHVAAVEETGDDDTTIHLVGGGRVVLEKWPGPLVMEILGIKDHPWGDN